MPDASDFALKEFEALRKEIADAVAETRSLERYAVTATAAVWTWLLVQPAEKPWIGFVKWIPACFCLLAAIRCIALLLDIVDHARYLREVEEQWGDQKVFRLEHYVASRNWYLTGTGVIIWLILVVGNLVMAWTLGPSFFVPPVK